MKQYFIILALGMVISTNLSSNTMITEQIEEKPANWEIVKWFEEGGAVDVYRDGKFLFKKMTSKTWNFSSYKSFDYRIVDERREEIK